MTSGSYNPAEVEPKWAQKWVDDGLFKAVDGGKKKKSYILIEFPYPSGERLHVGHARSYSCLDAVARKRRMQGENVMFPFGWDAFGLPAENYAIKTGIHPSITTKQNIDNARRQAISWGLSFDWSREINTTDPNYYKWTQWIFVQLFKRGLAYKENIPVNWCPSCKINLANEEVIDGRCERCGTQTERRMQSQWILRITKYADRLLKDLETVDYREDIKRQQVEWIGRKEGINITYKIEGNEGESVTVFTTRPDTNFGATFIVVAPEHDLVRDVLNGKIVVDKTILPAVRKYTETAKNKSELERIAEGRKKTGVFLGLTAINDLNGAKLPIYVSDFVLASFGTGAVIGVPGHDLRDFDFAREKGLPIVRVVVGADGDGSEITRREQVQEKEGIMINSEFLNGLDIHEATRKIMDFLVDKGWGKRVVTYHLRDWVFSRQHYWGEPIPMIYCQKCGWQPVPEADLPVELPKVEKYQPSQTGKSPLADIKEWTKVKCPNCGSVAERETDTMPNWGGSNWYFLRYCDSHNSSELAAMAKLKYWMPVDWYNGGMEHTTLHLLYSRFITKFLYDIGVVPVSEPYAKRTSHGVVLGPDGKRMSKSHGNVINPDEIVAKYGADTLRVYEMFIGPFEQTVVWDDRAMAGVHRFILRIRKLTLELLAGEGKLSEEGRRQVGRVVKKVGDDLEAMKFNTAISAAMEFVNWWEDHKEEMDKEGLKDFLKVLAPMAPFITEELWHRVGNKESIHTQLWPKYGEKALGSDELTIVVQVDGKTRGSVKIPRNLVSQKETERRAKLDPRINQHLQGKSANKVIWVEARLLNFVTV